MNASYTGDKISEIRKQKGWTQKDLAEKLHITDKAVSKWERGLNFPDISMLEKLADTLGISVVELLGIENNTNEQTVSDMSDLAHKEKERILKEIFYRGWITVLLGIVLWICVVYASKILPEDFLYGYPKTSYIGIPIGLIIGNGIVFIRKAKKLLK